MLDAERSTYATLAEETPKDRREICEGNELEDMSFVDKEKVQGQWLGPCKDSE
jgi:hypothetical protein